MLTSAQVAAQLHRSVGLITRFARNGRLRGQLVAREHQPTKLRWLFEQADVDAFKALERPSWRPRTPAPARQTKWNRRSLARRRDGRDAEPVGRRPGEPTGLP